MAEWWVQFQGGWVWPFGTRSRVSVCVWRRGGVRGEREGERFVSVVSPVISALWKGLLSMIMSPGEGHEWGNPCWLEDRLKHVHVLHLHGVAVARSLCRVSWLFDGTRCCSSNAGCVHLPSFLIFFFFSPPPSSYLPSPPLHRAHASSVLLTVPHISPTFLLSFTSENSCPFMQSILFSLSLPPSPPCIAFVCSEVSWTQDWRMGET